MARRRRLHLATRAGATAAAAASILFFPVAARAAGGAPPAPAYVVRSGDTLGTIAEHCHTSVAAIEAGNPLRFRSPGSPNLIHPGEKLSLQLGSPVTVRRGDNVWTIARCTGQ